MISLMFVILLACVVYIVVIALTHTFVLALVAALLVMLAGVGSHRSGGGPRWW